MADPREFTLIGSFTDHITPSLEKINAQLATLKANFAGVGSRKNTGFRGATQEIGKLVSAHKKLSESVKGAQSSIKSATSTLHDYRLEMAKAAKATREFQKAGNNLGGRVLARDMQLANGHAKAYLRTLKQIGMLSGKVPRGSAAGIPQPPRPPRGGGGGGMRPPTPDRGSTRGGGAGPGGFHMAEFGFAYTLGNALSQPIQNAIVQGFQIGVGLMTKPFEYFASHFGERVRDELSDLKAAGGFFSISQRQEGEKFIKTFDQAVDFTQENNKILAKLAAALPGSTQDYIEVSKRISDSVARTVVKDRGAAVKYAEELRQQDVNAYGREAITGMGPGAQQRAIQVMLGELTKKTVLAGQGGRAGAGGSMGAYGLPQLTERILSQQEVSMGQFQRYSAIFSDPMIMDALAREIPKINKTAASSVERFKAIQALYDSVLPPELIERYKRTVAGVAETFNTAIFGPETGLFGLGRKMEGLGEKFDEFGKVVVDAEGEVVKASLSLYDFVRDFIANIGQVFSPIVENITLFYDPLQKLGNLLADARRYTFKLLESFNYYVAGFKDLGFKDGNLRASLATIANLLRYVGAIGSGDFEKIIGQLKGKNVDFKAILTGLIDKLLNSKVAEDIGEMIGKVVGTVFSEVAKATGFISGRLVGTNKLFDGLSKGFQEAKGPEAFRNIFKDLFSMIGKVLLSIAKILPIEAYILGAAMLVLPAAFQALGMAIASALGGAIFGLTDRMGPLAQTMMTKAAASQGLGRRGKQFGAYQGAPQRHGRGGSIERLNRMRRYKMGQVASFAGEAAGLGYQALGRPGASAMGGMGKGLRKVGRLGRMVPGGALATGAIDMGIAMASGENFGKAAVGAIGTVLGGTIGTIFGPAGTVIGSIAGGMLADASSDFIIGVIDQNKAATMQMEAARKQVEAASISAVAKYGPEFGGKLGGIEALSQAMGGGAGVKEYTAEQLRLGKILPEQAQQWDILGTSLIRVNTTTDKVKKAQAAYDAAVRLNTGKQEEYKRKLEVAQNEQKAALSRITQNWEQMSANSRSKILSGADGIKAALDEAAGKIRGWNPKARTPENPNPTNAPLGGFIPSDPNQATIDRRKGIANLMARYRNEGKMLGTVEAAKKYDAGERYMGSLGDAVKSEMKHKPPGSDLVIANSSETVIPAAGGHGMADFVSVLRSGFATMVSAYRQAQQKQDLTLSAINQTLISNQQQTNARLSKLETKFSTPSIGGLGGGSIGGGVDAITPIAQQFGLQMTSGYRPGDPGYHGANRARDFSNGTGPTPQMMQFAQQMASSYGSSLKELIYTPLGFSIKNGQIVPPYAQGSHYNHVHVAYAAGLGNPAFFNNQKDAVSWEKKHLGSGIQSITSNTAELSSLMAQVKYGGKLPGGGSANWMQILEEDYQRNKNKPIPGGPSRNSGRGGLDMWEGPGSAYLSPSGMYQQGGSSTAAAPISVTSPITINTQPGQNADEIASIVAMKIGDAVAQARASSVFV